jgi:hypothetical protein
MTEFYQCPRCNAPFLAQDPLRVAQVGGYCLDCRKTDILEAFGLPSDFLTRRFGPQG